MGKLLLGAAAVVASLSLTAGVAAAQTGSVDTSGPGAFVKVEANKKNKVRVYNTNKVDLENRTYQKASSGDAKVKFNTTAGDVSTGDASNANALSATVNLNNTSTLGDLDCLCEGDGAGLDVDTSGPAAKVFVDANSYNSVKVNNYNKVEVENKTEQKAYSGDASAAFNTTVGDVTTGNASNTNSSSFSVSITN
jgi:hypothetical protein